MDLALECPVDYLPDLSPMGDFDFVLAHLALNYPEYLSYYTARRAEDGRMVVLDNGTNEMGRPCSIQEIEKVAGVLNPTLIVPPDFLGDGAKTMIEIGRGMATWGGDRILPVVQGRKLEWVSDAVAYMLSIGLTYLSIPYDILGDRSQPLTVLAEQRREMVETIVQVADRNHIQVRLHLLGLNTLEEVRYYSCQLSDEVVSLDTGSPYLNAVWGKDFGKVLTGDQELVPKGHYMNYGWTKRQQDPEILERAGENIRILKNLMKGRGKGNYD